MYTLTKLFRFEASHQLPNHQGKCRRMHGHSWVGKVIVQGSELKTAGSESGMLMDYNDISAILKPLVDDYLDHWHLNDSTGLVNPTSELIAQWIYERLQSRLPGLVAVAIAETCTSAAEYWP